jgi:hypothetical protein
MLTLIKPAPVTEFFKCSLAVVLLCSGLVKAAELMPRTVFFDPPTFLLDEGNGNDPLLPAQRAAPLANEACERQYQVGPFLPEQHPVLVERGRHRWGGDTNALSGLFALVTLELDGSYPEVTINYHTSSH